MIGSQNVLKRMPNDMNDVLLSIIVPVHNVEAYLASCIESIVTQMGAADELIVIDDGSSDGSPALLQQLKQRYAGLDFQLHRQDTAGVSAARNRGLAAARGKYIVFVDSDDVLRPGALAAIAQVAVAHEPDVIACDIVLWYPAKGEKKTYVRPAYAPDALTCDKEEILTVYLHDRHMYLWSKIFRRAIFQQLGDDPFPLQRVFEDVTVIPALLGACRNVYYLPYCIIDYRQRAGSISKLINEKHCLDLAQALLSVSQYFRQAPAGPATQWGFDHTMGQIYIGLFKDSYQLPLRTGSRVRRSLRHSFAQTLLHPREQLLNGVSPVLEETSAYPLDRLSKKKRRQLQLALDGNLWFGLRQTIGRKARLLREAVRNGQ
jgi:hypothetical protein